MISVMSHIDQDKDILISRRLTDQEKAWVNEILSANKEWSDVEVGELHAIRMCPCGCRSIAFETPSKPQNPKMQKKMGAVGILYIHTADDHVITIILFHKHGYLTGLEVSWDDDAPMPKTWTEMKRILSI
jgi:hypothetical protein